MTEGLERKKSTQLDIENIALITLGMKLILFLIMKGYISDNYFFLNHL